MANWLPAGMKRWCGDALVTIVSGPDAGSRYGVRIPSGEIMEAHADDLRPATKADIKAFLPTKGGA